MPAAPQIAFSGGYADFKLVKTRQVAQVIVEIPLADAQEFVKLFGLPNPAAEDRVALAKINPPKTIDADPPQPRTKREFKSLPAPQQAGIVANDKRFWSYLKEWHERDAENEDRAAQHIREICGVTSRKEFIEGTPALQRWNMLASAYLAWLEKERVGA